MMRWTNQYTEAYPMSHAQAVYSFVHPMKVSSNIYLRFCLRNNKPKFIFMKNGDPIVYISSLDFKIAPLCHSILQNNNFEREYLMPV